MLGGTAQGIGWALYEELAHDEYGQLRTGSFVDYAIPSTGAMPPVDLEIVEVPGAGRPVRRQGHRRGAGDRRRGGGRQRDRGRDAACGCASCR